MTRGFFGILLVLLLAPALLITWNARVNAARLASDATLDQLAIEQRFDDEVAVKQALHQTLRAASGRNGRERAADGARRLIEWRRAVESWLASKGARADCWAGVLSNDEIERVRDEIGKKRSPVLCRACWKIDAEGIDDRGAPVLRTQAVLAPSATGLKISRAGLAFVPDPASVASAAAGGRAVIGVSVWYEKSNMSAVFIAPEGFP